MTTNPDRRVTRYAGWYATDGVDTAAILTPAQITDTYLLALAVAHRGQLATLDRRLSARAVKGGAAALHLIDGKRP